VNCLKIKKTKIVELTIFLFGKPAWEINNFEGESLNAEFAKELERLGEELNKRLREIAKVHKILLENGWEAFGGLYDIHYTKDISLNEAKKELQQLELEKYLDHLEEREVEELTPETKE